MNFIPLKQSVTNCLLVKAGDHSVLIDTGYEDDWGLFRTRLNQAGVELFQISPKTSDMMNAAYTCGQRRGHFACRPYNHLTISFKRLKQHNKAKKRWERFTWQR